MFDNAYFVCFISYTYYLVNLAAKLPLNLIFNKKKLFPFLFQFRYFVFRVEGARCFYCGRRTVINPIITLFNPFADAG